MKVNEIFYSVQGEGTLVGLPTVFIRLQGCNLRCSYCDTSYAQDDEGGDLMTPVQIANTVFKLIPYQRRWVCITGGEPLLHVRELHALIEALHRLGGWSIEVETNGSFSPPSWSSQVSSWVADVKCPTSGHCGASRADEWLSMRRKDQVKFVVGNVEDLTFVRDTLRRRRYTSQVLVSPATMVLVDKEQGAFTEYWNKEWLQEVVDFCKEVNARFSLQVQKVVWGNKKGV